MLRPASASAIRAASYGLERRALRIELLDALARADALPPTAKARHRDLVGLVGHRLNVGGVGVSPIVADTTTGTYQPFPGGALMALIVPVREAPNDRSVPLLDLLAWLPRTGEIFTRLGNADILGWQHVEPLPPDGPVRVHTTPGTWCRSGGDGVVVIDWRRCRSQLGHLSAVAVDADAMDLGRRLDAALKPPPGHRPEVLVNRGRAA